MTTYTLMMLEISGIQPFIFGSNNLRINVSSSALVAAVTDKWLEEILGQGELDLQHNIEKGRPLELAIEADGLDVEAIYIGGGNAFLLVRDTADIGRITEQLSTRLLIEAPELRVVMATETISWDQEILTDKHQALRGKLATHKLHTAKNRPMAGLGVTSACAYTGQPAANLWYGTPVSHPIVTRVEKYLEYADQQFYDLIPDLKQGELEQVKDFEDFSGSDESGYIAIVHADGNRMGERIKQLSKKYNSPQQNRAYADKLRQFSESAREAAINALTATVKRLLQSRQEDKGKYFWQRSNAPKGTDLPNVVQSKHRDKETGEIIPVIPFRAIVFGGDDVTFVCHGRLGLAMAQHYLHVYGQQPIVDDEGSAVGRAGVAIVHTHFPFAVGYGLADSLATNAKEQGKDEKTKADGMRASIDWHFGVNGLIAGLDTIRSSSYTVAEGQLQARPLRLQSTTDWRSWETFEELVTEFQTGEKWHGRRNKVKALQTALRGGFVHTQSFLTNYDLPDLPAAKNVQPGARQTGWFGNTCVYFDALEAADFYIPLEVADDN
ncbi:MAG: hypothetical protein KDE48_20830 [Anaerolineales bacterium]|nr:hypothetical protein [Anaerolineales bacterium]